MKKILKEFREFAFESNVLNLAIAVIMGNAAGKMVSSLVESILMPIMGVLMGGKRFSELGITVGSETILYGAFIQSVVDFVIIALCVFFMMKGIKKLSTGLHLDKKEEEVKEKKPTTDELLVEIRDLLKKGES